MICSHLPYIKQESAQPLNKDGKGGCPFKPKSLFQRQKSVRPFFSCSGDAYEQADWKKESARCCPFKPKALFRFAGDWKSINAQHRLLDSTKRIKDLDDCLDAVKKTRKEGVGQKIQVMDQSELKESKYYPCEYDYIVKGNDGTLYIVYGWKQTMISLDLLPKKEKEQLLQDFNQGGKYRERINRVPLTDYQLFLIEQLLEDNLTEQTVEELRALYQRKEIKPVFEDDADGYKQQVFETFVKAKFQKYTVRIANLKIDINPGQLFKDVGIIDERIHTQKRKIDESTCELCLGFQTVREYRYHLNLFKSKGFDVQENAKKNQTVHVLKILKQMYAEFNAKRYSQLNSSNSGQILFREQLIKKYCKVSKPDQSDSSSRSRSRSRSKSKSKQKSQSKSKSISVQQSTLNLEENKPHSEKLTNPKHSSPANFKIRSFGEDGEHENSKQIKHSSPANFKIRSFGEDGEHENTKNNRPLVNKEPEEIQKGEGKPASENNELASQKITDFIQDIKTLFTFLSSNSKFKNQKIPMNSIKKGQRMEPKDVLKTADLYIKAVEEKRQLTVSEQNSFENIFSIDVFQSFMRQLKNSKLQIQDVPNLKILKFDN